MKEKTSITVKGINVRTFKIENEDYISLTDIARNKNADEPKDVVKNWMRSKATIEFLGLWEQLNNPDFKGVEFDPFMLGAGSNAFTLSPTKWISETNARGVISRQGNNGGTFAHKDIAFEFSSWVSPQFKLYLIKEFQRLKENESKQQKLEWNFQRALAKINYHIHKEAIKENLIPPELSQSQINGVYAAEADLLNVALFGCTAKEWRDRNPDKDGNMRDAASLEQLLVLSNLESINSVFIQQKLSSAERVVKLNAIAISQIKILLKSHPLKKLI